MTKWLTIASQVFGWLLTSPFLKQSKRDDRLRTIVHRHLEIPDGYHALKSTQITHDERNMILIKDRRKGSK